MQQQFSEAAVRRLREARKELGLTLEEVSAASGYGLSTIATLERNGKGSGRLLKRLVQVMKINTEWLESGVEPKFYSQPRAVSEEELTVFAQVRRDFMEVRESYRKFQETAKKWKAIAANAEAAQCLTEITLKSNIDSDLKPRLPALIAQLKRITATPGKKAELARFLRVPPARVWEWLNEKKEPGGETTLQLLYWVGQQEAEQQNAPAVHEHGEGKKAQSS